MTQDDSLLVNVMWGQAPRKKGRDEAPYTGRTGEGNGNPLQYSCLENTMDRGAWWANVHGVTQSRTRDYALMERPDGQEGQVSLF